MAINSCGKTPSASPKSLVKDLGFVSRKARVKRHLTSVSSLRVTFTVSMSDCALTLDRLIENLKFGDPDQKILMEWNELWIDRVY